MHIIFFLLYYLLIKRLKIIVLYFTQLFDTENCENGICIVNNSEKNKNIAHYNWQ